MCTETSRRRRPAPHARRSRERRARGPALSGRREVMGRAWRQECCARGRAFSPCAARPDKGRANPPHRARRGLHRRHATQSYGIYPGIARHRARMDIFRLSPNGTLRGLSRGLSPGLHRGLHRGFSGGFPGGLSRGAFPGAWRAEMRRLSQTRPVNSRTDVLRLSPHRARRGLPRRHATRRCDIYPGTARQRARTDIFRLSPNGTLRGLSRGLFPGLSGGFPGGLARGNATSIPNTARHRAD